MHHYLLARPRIHDLAGHAAARVNFHEIDAVRVLAGGHEEGATGLEVVKGDLVGLAYGREQMNPSAPAVKQRFCVKPLRASGPADRVGLPQKDQRRTGGAGGAPRPISSASKAGYMAASPK